MLFMLAGSASLASCTKCHDNDAASVLQSANAEAMLQLKSQGVSVTPDPSSGVWEAEDLRGRAHDGLNVCMADQIAAFAAARGYDSATDLGAGSGAYALYLQQHFQQIRCFDGNKAVTTTSKGLCSVLDLSLPQQLPASDLVYSLEVGEHIPKPREANFLQNVVSGGSKAVIMSWALPGQPGDGHVNCQPNDYIIGQMHKLSFKFDKSSTTGIRDYIRNNFTCAGEPNTPWFVDTLMVFMKA